MKVHLVHNSVAAAYDSTLQGCSLILQCFHNDANMFFKKLLFRCCTVGTMPLSAQQQAAHTAGCPATAPQGQQQQQQAQQQRGRRRC
jgi:hypothetical protein